MTADGQRRRVRTALVGPATALLVALSVLVVALLQAPLAHAAPNADVAASKTPKTRTTPTVLAPKSATDCGLGRATAVYHGTDPNRNLQRAIPDPLKVVSYPCDFPSSVRGIDLQKSYIALVAGGRLQRTIPFPGGEATTTLPAIVRAVKDPSWISLDSRGVVTLSASLVQESGTSLVVAAPVTAVHIIDNTTSVMKGSVSIAGSKCSATYTGVTVTSWDAKTNTPVTVDRRGRPFVLYENQSTFNVNNSRFQYLGSDVSSSYGVSWRQGATGTVDHSVFDHNFFGVYTYAAKDIVYENSIFSNNVYYGMDPHTYSSRLTIRNNTVFGNGHHGIVFSRFVTDSVVENNLVYGNKVNGIMMDYRSNGNQIRHNTVHDNGQGIVFSGSADNAAYSNVLSGNVVGIRGSHNGASGDIVRDNTISGGEIGVQVYGGATDFQVLRNHITGPSKSGIAISAPRTRLIDNMVTDAPVGVVADTVTSVSGGSLTARKVGIEVGKEGFVTVSAVRVLSNSKISVASPGWVRLSNTTFGVPTDASSTPLLGVLGLALLAFAVLCELVHLLRRRRLVQVNALAAGLASFQGSTDTLRTPRGRFTVRVAPADTGRTARHETSQAGPPSSLRKFRPDIEGLRAIAVVSVVLSHASLGVRGGFVGVDVFFVISGFLITTQLYAEAERRGRISFTGFYARRIRRILPAATIVTVATLLASWHWASPLRIAAIAKDGIAAALFSVNWRLGANGTDYFNASAPPSPFQHYWSLSVEEQFYVVWPLVIALVALLARKWFSLTKVLVGLLTAVVGVSAVLCVRVTSSNQPLAYFGTHTRAWELALGALVAIGARRLTEIPTFLRRLLGWGGLAAILAACFVFDDNTTFPGTAVMLPVFGAAAVIVAGCGTEVRFSSETVLLKRRIMQLFGKISYSLYLWHWPLLILGPDILGERLSVSDRLMLVGAGLCLSIISYTLVEQPVRDWRWLAARPRRAVGLGVLLICVSVAVALVVDDVGGPKATVTPAINPVQVTAFNQLDRGSINATPAQLVSQLTAAAALQSVPADLAPSAKDAPHSFSNTKGCEIGLTATTPKLPCNIFGDQASKINVLLVGDSHAGMWVNALSDVAVQNHWRLTVLTKSDCAVGDYPDLVNPQLKRVYRECNAWRPKMISYAQLLKPAMIIVGSETRAIAEAEPNGLYDSLLQLAKSGAKLVFLADTPSPKVVGNVPDCVVRHTQDLAACDIPRSKAGLESPGRVAEIQGAQRAGATVVDPTSWMCTSTTCPVVIDHELVYLDDSHITALFGQLRVPQLSAALLSALKR